MLLRSFFTYRVIEQSDRKLCVEIVLNRQHKIFTGHFVNNPVVPGVCQIQMVTDILTDTYRRGFQLLKANNIKFLSMINPEELQTLNLELKLTKITETRLNIFGVLSDRKRVCMKIQGVFSERRPRD